ncbi:ATP-grasp domain-containing protein [Streptacidiphilus sp. N1-12]|uniref:ATP-grasp domain-containing protein n=2 Tax=Streptacidiphilus alkalitolerans TaxID=3342712 RepID=A0ABV6WKS9_9ACTN
MRILMVMPYRQFLGQARAEGFSTVALWDPALESPGYLREVAAGAEAYLTTDFGDTAGLRRVVAETAAKHRVERIVHLGREETMLPVAEEAERLGLAANPSRAVARLNDKSLLRRLLAEHGLSPVEVRRFDTSDQVRSALGELTLPVVAKPTALAGSRGVRLISGPADLAAWERSLAGYGYRGPVLVEEYLRGPEYSVETLSAEGRHQLVGITAKEVTAPPTFVETAHTHPAPLPAADERAMAELVTRMLDAAGHRFGPVHTEVVLTGAGPRVVESQTRLGGGRIPLLVQLSRGYDLERAVFAALAGRLEPAGPARGVARIEFFDFRPGTVVSVSGVEQAGALPFVHELSVPFEPGGQVPVTVDAKTRHGHVVVTAPDVGAAVERCAQVRQLIRLETR